MRLYLDCEFNEFKGALISMALVDENGREWYEVVSCENPGPWVAEHVMPILGRGPVSIPLMQASLSAWLALYDSVHIVADWPEDIAHFCQALITGPGMRLNTPPLTMEVVRIDAESELPHNALADARGIRTALAAREPAQAVAVPDGFALIDVAKIRVALSVLAGLREIEWGEESGQPYSKIAAVENTIEFALEDGRACSRTAERIPHGLAERVVRMMHLASIGAERAPNDRGEWNRLVAEIRAMLAAAKEGKPS